MALIFTREWQAQRARNRNEARRLLAEYGDDAPLVIKQRLKASTSKDRAHWRRVLSHVKSV